MTNYKTEIQQTRERYGIDSEEYIKHLCSLLDSVLFEGMAWGNKPDKSVFDARIANRFLEIESKLSELISDLWESYN